MNDKIKKWLIAAGVLILLGAVITAVAAGLGAREVSVAGTSEKFNINLGTPFEIVFTSNRSSGDMKHDTVTFTKDQTETVTGMEIGWNAGTIEVETWDNDYIQAESEYDASEKAPSFEIRGNKLCISSETGTASIGIGINVDPLIKKATVYVPKDMHFETLDAELNAGIMDIRDVSAEKELDAELNAGQLTLRNITSAGKTKVEVNAGDFRMKDAMISGSTQIEVNAGKADLDGTIAGDVEADVAAGLLEIRSNVPLSETSVKIDVSAGAAEFNGHTIAGFSGGYTDQKAGAPNSFAADVMAGALKVKYAE